MVWYDVNDKDVVLCCGVGWIGVWWKGGGGCNVVWGGVGWGVWRDSWIRGDTLFVSP